MKAKTYRLFFSWQSEDTKSQKILEDALQRAVDEIKDKYGLIVEIDYSTLGESGMPSINQTILRKIDACDMFLADVTPVCNYQQKVGNGLTVNKETPNPNVLLELGYAMSALGVGYVIVAAHQGKWLPKDLPFDINHHSIYCFKSSSCELTSLILEVIYYITRNGRHRHLDKPYLVNLIERTTDKVIPSKRLPIEPVICEESTVFFRKRMADAFPGCRGLVEFTKEKDIDRHLSKLLKAPAHFNKKLMGSIDPIWWFRSGSGLHIDSFKKLGKRRYLIGWEEYVIRRIVAFVDNGRYYANYVYVETEAQKSTGLYDYTPERIEELREYLDGNVDEEYAVYKPCFLYRKLITKQEEDDGSTKVFGRIVKMKRDKVEARCRRLTDYNFIIAAKGSPFNSMEFERTSDEYFKGLLDGSVTIDQFNEYMMHFPKSDKNF